MAATNNMAWWGSIVSWVVVMVGWIVINAQNNGRETRKEVRAALDGTIRRLEKLESLGRQYHLSTAHDDSIAEEIKLHLKKLWPESVRLNLVDESALAVRVASLRRSITLRNFDSAEHAALLAGDEILAEIAESVSALEEMLQRGFAEKYWRRRYWI